MRCGTVVQLATQMAITCSHAGRHTDSQRFLRLCHTQLAIVDDSQSAVNILIHACQVLSSDTCNVMRAHCCGTWCAGLSADPACFVYIPDKGTAQAVSWTMLRNRSVRRAMRFGEDRCYAPLDAEATAKLKKECGFATTVLSVGMLHHDPDSNASDTAHEEPVRRRRTVTAVVKQVRTLVHMLSTCNL